MLLARLCTVIHGVRFCTAMHGTQQAPFDNCYIMDQQLKHVLLNGVRSQELTAKILIFLGWQRYFCKMGHPFTLAQDQMILLIYLSISQLNKANTTVWHIAETSATNSQNLWSEGIPSGKPRTEHSVPPPWIYNVLISQTNRLVSQERMSPGVGTSVFIMYYVQTHHLVGGSNIWDWCVTPQSSPTKGYWHQQTIFNILNILQQLIR